MIQLVDDQILGSVLRGDGPPLPEAETYTTGYWYFRLCRAVVAASGRSGALSRSFDILPLRLRHATIRRVLELPEEMGMESLRTLAPLMAGLSRRHALNVLGTEVLAAAVYLDAAVFLSASSPRLERALRTEGVRVQVVG